MDSPSVQTIQNSRCTPRSTGIYSLTARRRPGEYQAIARTDLFSQTRSLLDRIHRIRATSDLTATAVIRPHIKEDRTAVSIRYIRGSSVNEVDEICRPYLRNWSDTESRSQRIVLLDVRMQTKGVSGRVTPGIAPLDLQISVLRWECDRNQGDMGAWAQM